MKKSKKITLISLFATLILSVCCCFATAFAASPTYVYTDEGATIYRLTSYYHPTGGFPINEWQKWGATGDYSESIQEYITDTQADYGDVTFHTGSTPGTLDYSNGFGFRRYGNSKLNGAFMIDGLNMKFYSNFAPTSAMKEFFFIFNSSNDLLNSGRFFAIGFNFNENTGGTNDGQVQLRIFWQTDESAGNSYGVDGTTHTWLSWQNNFGNDFDMSTNNGTANLLKFEQDENEKLCMYLNGEKIVDLTSVCGSSIVDTVITPSGEDGMYFSMMSDVSCVSKTAIKITDMYTKARVLDTPAVENTDNDKIDGNYTTEIKTLIGETSGSETFSSWEAVGNTSVYKQSIKVIEDNSQPDKGDVIVHTNVENGEFVASGYGISKHSEPKDRDKATWNMYGLNMKFFSYANAGFQISFGDTYSEITSNHYLSIKFSDLPNVSTSGSAKITLAWKDLEGKTQEVSKTLLTFNNDYDYFSDPAVYSGQSFKGTVNTINIYLSKTGNLCLMINGQYLFNLSELGIVSDVFAPVGDKGMYMWHSSVTTGNFCFKITDIYNETLNLTTTTPDVASQFYTFDSSKTEYSVNGAGLFEFSKSATATNYDVTYKTKQNLNNLSVKFMLNQLDDRSVPSISVGESIKVEFNYLSDEKVNAKVYIDGVENGTKEIEDFYFYPQELNELKIVKNVKYAIFINNVKYDTEVDVQDIDVEKVDVKFSVTDNTTNVLDKTIIIPVRIASSVPETIKGQIVKGNKEEGVGYNISNTGYITSLLDGVDGGFNVTLTQKLLPESLVVSFYHSYVGSYTSANNFVVKIGDNGIYMQIKFYKVGTTEKVAVQINDNGNIETLEDIEFTYNWKNKKLRKLEFFIDENTYRLRLDEKNVLTIDDTSKFNKLVAVKNGFNNQMATVIFDIGTGYNEFCFVSYDWAVSTTVTSGWSKGSYGGLPEFAYSDGTDVGTLRVNGYSYIYNKSSVVVNGFEMRFKSFIPTDGNFSRGTDFIIAPGMDWYSNNSEMGVSASFNFQIREEVVNGVPTILAKIGCQYKYDNYVRYFTENGYDDYCNIESYFNYNNNIENVIKLSKNANGLWRWSINGFVIEPLQNGKWKGSENSALLSVPDTIANNPDYSALYDLVYEEGGFGSGGENGAGYLQVDSGVGITYKITYLSINNDEPIYNGATFPELVTGTRYAQDLRTLFNDPDGDSLTFEIIVDDSKVAFITGNTLKLYFDKAGVHKIKLMATDSLGGTCVATFSISVSGEDCERDDEFLYNKKDYYDTSTESTTNGDTGDGCNGRTAGILYVTTIIVVSAAIMLAKKFLTKKG